MYLYAEDLLLKGFVMFQNFIVAVFKMDEEGLPYEKSLAMNSSMHQINCLALHKSAAKSDCMT